MLSTLLNIVYQRSGLQNLLDIRGLNQFQQGVIRDISSLVYQLNTIYKPLVSNLAEFTDNLPLERGMAGDTLWADTQATSDSKALLWSSDAVRKTTVKEALEHLLARIEALENV